MSSPETVLVTGASGFLGHHLLPVLKSLELNIVPLSRKYQLKGGVQILDYSSIPMGDIVIHLAEEPDRSKVNSQGDAYVKKSAETISALIKCARKRLVYASSSAVYGNSGTEPYGIDSKTFSTDTYSKSKLLNESIVLSSGGCVVRFSNIIGPGMSPNNVVSTILSQVAGEGPIRLREDSSVRDYLSVEDAANALGLSIVHKLAGVVNVGTGIGTSVRQLAETILSIESQQLREIVSIAASSGYSYNVLDISETTRKLKWMPSITLKEELTRLLHHRIARSK